MVDSGPQHDSLAPVSPYENHVLDDDSRYRGLVVDVLLHHEQGRQRIGRVCEEHDLRHS